MVGFDINKLRTALVLTSQTHTYWGRLQYSLSPTLLLWPPVVHTSLSAVLIKSGWLS